MSHLLHCDIGEVITYLKQSGKVSLAIRLSDCLSHSNEQIAKLVIRNHQLEQERADATAEIERLRALINKQEEE